MKNIRLLASWCDAAAEVVHNLSIAGTPYLPGWQAFCLLKSNVMSPMPQQTTNTFPYSLWHSSPLSIPLVSTATRLQILKVIYSFKFFRTLFFGYIFYVFCCCFVLSFFCGVGWGGCCKCVFQRVHAPLLVSLLRTSFLPSYKGELGWPSSLLCWLHTAHHRPAPPEIPVAR